MFSVYYMIHGRGVKVYIKACVMVDLKSSVGGFRWLIKHSGGGFQWLI